MIPELLCLYHHLWLWVICEAIMSDGGADPSDDTVNTGGVAFRWVFGGGGGVIVPSALYTC